MIIKPNESIENRQVVKTRENVIIQPVGHPWLYAYQSYANHVLETLNHDPDNANGAQSWMQLKTLEVARSRPFLPSLLLAWKPYLFPLLASNITPIIVISTFLIKTAQDKENGELALT